jgi:hypothetical protein
MIILIFDVSRGVRSIEDVQYISYLHTYTGIYIYTSMSSIYIHHPCKLSNVVDITLNPVRGNVTEKKGPEGPEGQKGLF